MKKKLPVVTVAQVEEADRLADLPLEATVALAEVAGASRKACWPSRRPPGSS